MTLLIAKWANRITPGWLKRAVLWAVGGLLVVLGIWTAGKREGRQRADLRAQKKDYRNAQDIRDRVERDLPDRLREYEGRGFRDD